MASIVTEESAACESRVGSTTPPCTPPAWYGLLSVSEVETLQSSLASTVVCPGYTSQFGTLVCADGKLQIPGSTRGFWDAKKILSSWSSKATNDKYSWWPDKLKQRQVDPITIGDILKGLQVSKWREYSRVWRLAVDAQSAKEKMRRRRARQKETLANAGAARRKQTRV